MSATTPKKPPSSSSGSSSSRDALASLRIERPDPNAKRGSGRIWIWLLGTLVLIGGGAVAYRAFSGQGSDLAGSTWVPEIMQNRIEVRLKSVAVQKGRSADAVVVATGYLESRRQAKIGARAAGRIDEIFFEEGNEVTEGEVLAELEHKDLEASLSAASASVARAKASLAEQEITIELAEVDKARAERLWNAQSIAESEYDQVRFALRAAKARHDSIKAEISLAEAQEEQAKQLKENMFIRAPFDGTVISKDAEVGESILPGGMGAGSGRGSVATIADLAHLEIECDVQEDFISRVREGQEADIAVDAVPHKKYHGTVRKIIPMGDRARATIKVQVQINDADEFLFPEMSGTVFFLPDHQEKEVSDEPRIFCPTSAITTDAEGNQYVWVVDAERHAQRISVQAAEDRDGRSEITGGLKGRERVVVNPQELYEGAPVSVTE